MNPVIENMNKLPTDIQNLMIYEHINPNLDRRRFESAPALGIILQELNEILNSENSMKLVYEPLAYYLENVVLQNEIIIKYLITNDEIFHSLYEEHIIKKEKSFIFLNNFESMALSWLMNLYH